MKMDVLYPYCMNVIRNVLKKTKQINRVANATQTIKIVYEKIASNQVFTSKKFSEKRYVIRKKHKFSWKVFESLLSCCYE